MSHNEAFVFIKPHAVTDKTKELVKATLEAKGIEITSEGAIASETIDKDKLIDQHYYAIASKATILPPKDLNIPEDKFEAQFGLKWTEALEKGVVHNAMTAVEYFGWSGVEGSEKIDVEWGKAKKAGKLIKFGGGFYCGLIDTVEGKDAIYVFNAFFMSMRSKFCVPGECIYYYTVKFAPETLAWKTFRGEVLGPTDPAEAPATSVRGMIMAQWEALGLKSEPNTGDNGVHASASPFEALAERVNWLKADVSADATHQALVDAGVSAETIKAWSVDPVVPQGEDKKGSIFDALEDMDIGPCVAKCGELAKLS